MRIQNEQLAHTSPNQTERSSAPQGSGRDGNPPGIGASGPGSDELSISNLASHIGRLQEVQSSERASRLEALARAYTEGRYQVDARQLASRIASEWLANGTGPAQDQ